jgi:hypothetical protein
MKKILLTGMMLCLTASMAMAAAGLNLYWNPASSQCPVAPGASNTDVTFTCDNNDDALPYMVLSFTPGTALVGFRALSVVMDGQTPGDVPAWWQIYNAGSCRPNSISTGVQYTPNPTAPCVGNGTTKLWTALPSGGMTAYQTALYPPPLPLPAPAPNRFRIKAGFSMGSGRANPLVVTTQYNAMYVLIDAANTVDVGACAGCADGATIVLNEIYIVGSGATETITAPLTNRCITWQGGSGASVCDATPARNSTWGQVKGLYR